MARLRMGPGIPGKIRKRLKGSFKPLRRGISSSLAFALFALVGFLGCLFAAEVALGRRVTRRDAELERHRGKPGPEGEELLPSPFARLSAPSNAPAGRDVGFFGQSHGQCPVPGGRASDRRAPGLANGFSRCIHFPPCRHTHAASRFSTVSVQDWLKLNQPPGFRSNHRRLRDS